MSPFLLSPFRLVAVLICRRSGLSPFWFVVVSVCRRSGLSSFRLVVVLTVAVLVCRRFDCTPTYSIAAESVYLSCCAFNSDGRTAKIRSYHFQTYISRIESSRNIANLSKKRMC